MARGQDNGTTILLGLKDYKVGEVVGGEERVVVKTSPKGKEKRCPYCGSGKLYGHGVCKPREVLHTWSNGRRVYLDLQRRRWKCRDCKRTFAEGRDLVRSRSRLTRHAIQTYLTFMALNLKRLVKLLTGVSFRGEAKASVLMSG